MDSKPLPPRGGGRAALNWKKKRSTRLSALIEAGLPPARAARQLGIGRSTLYRIIAERKVA